MGTVDMMVNGGGGSLPKGKKLVRQRKEWCK
jgi:hypothetical protein